MNTKAKKVLPIILLILLTLFLISPNSEKDYTSHSYVAGDTLFDDLNILLLTLTHIKENNSTITFNEYVELKIYTDTSLQALDYFRQTLSSSHKSAPITLDINNSLLELSNYLEILNEEFNNNTSNTKLSKDMYNKLIMVRHELSVYKTRLDDIYP